VLTAGPVPTAAVQFVSWLRRRNLAEAIASRL